MILLVQHDIVIYDGAINLTSDPYTTHLATILDKNKESFEKIFNMGYKGNIFIMNLKIK